MDLVRLKGCHVFDSKQCFAVCTCIGQLGEVRRKEGDSLCVLETDNPGKMALYDGAKAGACQDAGQQDG